MISVDIINVLLLQSSTLLSQAVNHIGEDGEINLERHSNVKFPVKELFPCGLPGEFTICLSYSSSEKNRKDKCLFYLDDPTTDSEAVLIICFEPEDNKLQVEYFSVLCSRGNI